MLRLALSALLLTACAAPLPVTVGDLQGRSHVYAGQEVEVVGVATQLMRARVACVTYDKRDLGGPGFEAQVPQGPLVERMDLCVQEKWWLSRDGAEIEVSYLSAAGSPIRSGTKVAIVGTWIRTEDDRGVLDAQRVTFY
jgi:hypothetical protein